MKKITFLLISLLMLSIAAFAQTATTQDATDITATTAKLHGVANASGGGPYSVEFWYRIPDPFNPPPFTKVNGVPSTVSGSVDTDISLTLTGLEVNTNYEFYLIVDGDVNGGQQSFYTGAAGLPIDLMSFESTALKTGVNISWKTASEINNDYFILEKSTDAYSFEEVARMSGAGNSNNVLSYEFYDNNLSNEVIYYRLTQVDYDGKSETFPVIAVRAMQETILIDNIYTEQGQLNIQVAGSSNNEVNVSVIDITGKTLINDKVSLSNSLISMDISSFSRGIYFAIIQNGEERIVKKFVY